MDIHIFERDFPIHEMHAHHHHPGDPEKDNIKAGHQHITRVIAVQFGCVFWPEDTSELNRYYPGDVLVTGFDIIFFWVARMMMMSMHFMDGEVPFKDVYIHALVRDEHGQKMSKSKGNVLDPLDLTAKYGADALRFTLVAMAAQGRDLKLSETRIESYRNFATKLWNAARFLEMNGCTDPHLPKELTLPENRWILSELNQVSARTQAAIDGYRFNEAADAIYQFVWNSYCDWYIEFIKPGLSETEESRRVAGYVLHQVLHILHPFMPFISEELNQKIFSAEQMLIGASWPQVVDVDAGRADLSVVIDLISEIRTMRSEMNVPLNAKPVLEIKSAHAEHKQLIEQMSTAVLRLARVEVVSFDSEGGFAKGTARTSLAGMDIGLPLAGILDFEAERARLTKEIKGCEAEASKLRGKLSNEGFLAKAPEAVVEENRRRLTEEESRLSGLQAALNRLDADM